MPKKKVAKKRSSKKAAKKVVRKKATLRWFIQMSTNEDDCEAPLFHGVDENHLTREGQLCTTGMDVVETIMGSGDAMLPGALIELFAKLITAGITNEEKKKPEVLMKTEAGRQYLKEALAAFDSEKSY